MAKGSKSKKSSHEQLTLPRSNKVLMTDYEAAKIELAKQFLDILKAVINEKSSK